MQQVTRLRAQRRTTNDWGIEGADWSDPDTKVFNGFAFFLQGSGVALNSRLETFDNDLLDRHGAVLTIFEPNADIVAGDRVILPDGLTYSVNSLASSAMNPWTGWQPTTTVAIEVLKEAKHS